MKVGKRIIRRGDEVTITDSDGNTVTGVVETANNYGGETFEDWYIEVRDSKGYPHYWKQGIDGGNVVIRYVGPVS